MQINDSNYLHLAEPVVGDDIIYWRARDRAAAFQLLANYTDTLETETRKFGFGFGKITWSGEDDGDRGINIIGEHTVSEQLIEQADRLVYAGEIAFNGTLIKMLQTMHDSDNPMGACEIQSGRQIFINSSAQKMLGLSGKEAVKLKRSDYFVPSDLNTLNRNFWKICQSLDSNDDKAISDPFEASYRAKLPRIQGYAMFKTLFTIYRTGGIDCSLGLTIAEPQPIELPENAIAE